MPIGAMAVTSFFPKAKSQSWPSSSWTRRYFQKKPLESAGKHPFRNSCLYLRIALGLQQHFAIWCCPSPFLRIPKGPTGSTEVGSPELCQWIWNQYALIYLDCVLLLLNCYYMWWSSWVVIFYCAGWSYSRLRGNNPNYVMFVTSGGTCRISALKLQFTKQFWILSTHNELLKKDPEFRFPKISSFSLLLIAILKKELLPLQDRLCWPPDCGVSPCFLTQFFPPWSLSAFFWWQGIYFILSLSFPHFAGDCNVCGLSWAACSTFWVSAKTFVIELLLMPVATMLVLDDLSWKPARRFSQGGTRILLCCLSGTEKKREPLWKQVKGGGSLPEHTPRVQLVQRVVKMFLWKDHQQCMKAIAYSCYFVQASGAWRYAAPAYGSSV